VADIDPLVSSVCTHEIEFLEILDAEQHVVLCNCDTSVAATLYEELQDCQSLHNLQDVTNVRGGAIAPPNMLEQNGAVLY
jgi:hypothetical protein